MSPHDQSRSQVRARNKCRTTYTNTEQVAIVGSILTVAGLILCALLGWL